MPWNKALPMDREKLISLVKKNEWEQLHFSSALQERARFKLTGKGTIYVLKSSRKSIEGALFISSGGALHCCFEPENLTRNDIEQLKRLVIGRSFFSFIGRTDRIHLIEDLYGSPQSHEVDYYLYELSRSRVLPNPEIRKGIYFRPADLSDFDELYFLEAAYQKEEVMRNPDQLNESYLRRKFYKQLGRDIIWIALTNGKIIAKGGTNALGFEYAQLGGVYTVPEERNKGIGAQLIHHLALDLKSRGWGTALFVREDNPAAIALYEKSGYSRKGSFRIVYPLNEEID
jgi:ribosomal protein S18 acetylase RimI-like enzyme